MVNKFVNYAKKYEEAVAYLIVGGLNTILAWVVWLILSYIIFDVNIIWQNMAMSIISWLICNGFVYFMNRIFVFKSKASNILKEFVQFSTGRLLTLILDSVMMVMLINLCKMNKIIAKIITSLTVIVANYLISKLVVFRKR